MEIIRGDKKNVIEKVTEYDSNKRYTWTPQDKFELSGEQFGVILNAFRAVLNTPEAVRILLISKANEAIESVMADNVEKGIIKEITEGHE